MTSRILGYLSLLGLSIFFYASPSYSDVSCIRATNRVVNGKVTTRLRTVTRPATCRRGEVTVPAGETGPQGAEGPEGADGQLRIYGDGSAGAKVVSANETLGADAAPDNDTNLSFTDFTVNSGVNLTVPSGTVIRCTGTFTNNGTIVVEAAARGGVITGEDSSMLVASRVFAHPGIGLSAAGNAESGDDTAARSGGLAGTGLSEYLARRILNPGVPAGGGGGGNIDATQSAGGGSLLILCQTAIVNNGSISAPGVGGSVGGGGGGGVIILASKASVTSGAGSSISAVGGAGENSDTNEGASGGGGGGIVHLLAPSVNTTGATISVAGGTGGDGNDAGGSGLAVTVTTLRAGGGGGGASGGSGGNGASIIAASTDSADGTDGSAGHSIVTLVDPTSLF